MTVHLVAEAQDYRVMVGTDGLGVSAQIIVVPSGGNRSDAGFRRVHLHERYRAIVSHGLGEAGLERLQPSAVVNDHIRALLR